MMRTVNPIRCGKMLTESLRNNWSEVPLTVSLAVSGISIQAYASYMMVKAGHYAPVFPFTKYETSSTS